ncbi:MAG: alpha/beta hydrolase family protein [Thermomicrobiales bacterium]
MTATDHTPHGDPIATWRYAREAWRLSRRMSPRMIDLYLRLRSGRGLPRSFWARFVAMQIPEETINRALGEVRGLGDWMGAWNRAAQRHLGEARREDAAGRWQEAATARRHASMCYHAAYLVTDTDARTVRALRAASVAVFGQALPLLMAETRRVAVRWRTSELPGYLAHSATRPTDRRPLVVLLNGATTTKEEMLLWARPFLAQRLSVLALDWPGTGEAHAVGPVSSQCDDVTEGILSLVAEEPALDPERIGLVGFSLGGAVAVRAAAQERRMAACVVVTAPFDAAQWVWSVNPIVRQQLVGIAGAQVSLEDVADDFSPAVALSRLRCPLLVFGAGRDLVVPPEEAMNLATAGGDLATLVWYPTGAHGLYAFVDDWTAIAARWLAETIGDGAIDVDEGSTWVDDDFAGDAPPVVVRSAAARANRDET